MPQIAKALTLNDLPAPPPGKVGFPWTEQSEPVGDRMLDGSEYPRISIVTPSYNQGQFIEETIRSVLLQGYPNLEYIIIDGGSNDNSVEIIERYESFLAHWVSECDRGQTHAINKGLDIATGEILCWLNSDDYFLPDALATIARRYIAFDQKSEFWIVGKGIEKDQATGSNLFPHASRKEITKTDLAWTNPIAQPAVFWSRRLKARPKEELNYVMDWELWNQFMQVVPPTVIDEYLAVTRVYETTKTATGKRKLADELYAVATQYGHSKSLAFLYRYVLWEARHQGASRQLSVSSIIPKIYQRFGRLAVRIMFGKAALDKYKWDFCA